MMQIPNEIELAGLPEKGKTYVFNEEGQELKPREGFLSSLFEFVPTNYQLFTLDNRQGVLIEAVDVTLDVMGYGLMQEQLDPVGSTYMPMPTRKARDQSKLVDALREVFDVKGEVEGEEEDFEEAMGKLDPRVKAYKVDLKSNCVLELTVQEQLC